MPCIMLNVFYKQRSNKHERNSDLNLFHFFRPNLYRICFKVDNQEIDWFFSDMNFWSALPILTFGRHFQETEKKTVFGIDFYLMLRHLQRDNSIHSFQRHTSKPILSRPLDIEIYLNNYSNNSSKKKFCVCDHQMTIWRETNIIIQITLICKYHRIGMPKIHSLNYILTGIHFIAHLNWFLFTTQFFFCNLIVEIYILAKYTKTFVLYTHTYTHTRIALWFHLFGFSIYFLVNTLDSSCTDQIEFVAVSYLAFKYRTCQLCVFLSVYFNLSFMLIFRFKWRNSDRTVYIWNRLQGSNEQMC